MKILLTIICILFAAGGSVLGFITAVIAIGSAMDDKHNPD